MEDFKYCSDSSSELKNGKDKEDRGGEGGEEKKKKRLRIDQVRQLEKVYERDTKLDQERKIKLAKELGIQPRQVAIWFQNHRARWKTKRLEKDFLLLKSNYESLQLNYTHVQRQKQFLLAELRGLKEKLGEEKNYSIEKPSITENQNQNQQLIDQNNSTINRNPSSDHHPPLTMAEDDHGLSWQQQFLSMEEEEEEDHLQKYFLSTGEDESCNMMKMMMPLPTDQIPLFWYFSDMTN